jgi:hypothetical protein
MRAHPKRLPLWSTGPISRRPRPGRAGGRRYSLDSFPQQHPHTLRVGDDHACGAPGYRGLYGDAQADKVVVAAASRSGGKSGGAQAPLSVCVHDVGRSPTPAAARRRWDRTRSSSPHRTPQIRPVPVIRPRTKGPARARERQAPRSTLPPMRGVVWLNPLSAMYSGRISTTPCVAP